MRVIINKAQCLKCKEIIESKDVHDYKTCSCGNLSVDGGLEYCKRSCQDLLAYRDMSVTERELNEKAYKIIRNKKPIPQAKKLVEEAFEFAESILDYEHGVGTFAHLVEEFDDVSLVLKQFELYYKIKEYHKGKGMNYKADRTLKKIEQEGSEINMDKEKLEVKLKHLEDEQFFIDMVDRWTENDAKRYNELTKEIKEVRKQLEVIKKGEQNDKDNN